VTRVRGVGKGWKGRAIERFWRKAEYDPATGCVVWIGACCSAGYGTFYDGQRVRPAHRWLWEQFNGPIPDGFQLDHTCHTADGSCPGGEQCEHRRCVNLTHLEVVTGSENVRRGLSPLVSGALNRAKTHCPANHPYDGANTWSDKNGHRHCRSCLRDRQRELRARRRVAA